jgi:predicted HicB family RNase H-like nuclease
VTNEKEAVALREAATAWAGGASRESRWAGDREFKRLDNKLMSAARKLLAMPKKRSYSREFTPKTQRRVMLTIDKIPPTLYAAVKAKAKREGVSLRALVLGWLKDWVEKSTTTT